MKKVKEAKGKKDEKKPKKMEEAKKGGKGWLSKPGHAKPPKGHGPGKGKKAAPYSKSMTVKGTAGRGR